MRGLGESEMWGRLKQNKVFGAEGRMGRGLGEPWRIWEVGSAEKIQVFGAEWRGQGALGESGKWDLLKK